MSHKHHKDKRKKEEICPCDRPPKFTDRVGKGELDSSPIIVFPGFNVGTSLNLPPTTDNPNPGPFSAAALLQQRFPNSQKFFGIQPRRNTPDKSPEKAGKLLNDDKRKDDDRFYKPRAKVIHRNFAKKK